MLLTVYGYIAFCIKSVFTRKGNRYSFLSDVLEDHCKALSCPAQMKVVLGSQEILKGLGNLLIEISLEDFWSLLGFWFSWHSPVAEQEMPQGICSLLKEMYLK